MIGSVWGVRECGQGVREGAGGAPRSEREGGGAGRRGGEGGHGEEGRALTCGCA